MKITYLEYDKLYEEKCIATAEAMIYDIILKMYWGLMSLVPVRKV